MKSERLTLDLTGLKKLSGYIIPGDPVELSLIELFTLKHTDSSPIELFTKMVLKKLFMDDKDHDYHEINVFFREKNYVHMVLKFLDTLEICLLNSVKPDVLDIRFNSYVENGEKLIVVFDVMYAGDNYVTKITKKKIGE